MTTTLSKLTAVRKDRVGTGLIWLSGAALAFQILLVVGLLLLLVVNGMGYFWQRPLVELVLKDGTKLCGEVHDTESILDRARGDQVTGTREKLKIGNRDVYGLDFKWIDAAQVASRSLPSDLVLLERSEYGNFYGRVLDVKRAGKSIVTEKTAVWPALQEAMVAAEQLRAQVARLEKGPQGALNTELEQVRLAERRAELSQLSANAIQAKKDQLAATRADIQQRHERLATQIQGLNEQLQATSVAVTTADARNLELPIGKVLSATLPNQLGAWDKTKLYAQRLLEFLWGDPRESNTEGGIFPALFGTVLMVFLMTFVVTPLGVLAALYLREYSRQGWLVRTVRIAVNNLAGVPSIVFGMFGLGFFVYGVGGTIDQLFYKEALPAPTFGTGGILWAALTLALLTVPVVIVATEEGLSAVPRNTREGALALGATKLETTWRVVLPAAAPGILTGVILAIARAAGEVAPLMIVGMVKLAALPVDSTFPFLHLERKFMHLGFHIYDVGFQSPNVEATKPLVYATALLLVGIVTVMNLGAIRLRNHLRRKYASSAV